MADRPRKWEPSREKAEECAMARESDIEHQDYLADVHEEGQCVGAAAVWREVLPHLAALQNLCADRHRDDCGGCAELAALIDKARKSGEGR